MQPLGKLGAKHIFFQRLYLQWFGHKATGSIESRMAKELRLLPAQLTAYRKQVQTFLERILDIDRWAERSGRICGKDYRTPSSVLNRRPSALA